MWRALPRQAAAQRAKEQEMEHNALLVRMEDLSSQAHELGANFTEKDDNESNTLCRLESTQRALEQKEAEAREREENNEKLKKEVENLRLQFLKETQQLSSSRDQWVTYDSTPVLSVVSFPMMYRCCSSLSSCCCFVLLLICCAGLDLDSVTCDSQGRAT